MIVEEMGFELAHLESLNRFGSQKFVIAEPTGSRTAVHSVGGATRSRANVAASGNGTATVDASGTALAHRS